MWLDNNCHSSASGLDYNRITEISEALSPSLHHLHLELHPLYLPAAYSSWSTLMVTSSLDLHQTLTLTWVGGNPGQVM